MGHWYQFSQAGTGNRVVPSSIDSKTHIWGSLKSELLSRSMASYHYCRSKVKAGVPRDDPSASASHQGSPSLRLTLDSLLEVLLDRTDCAHLKSRAA